MLFYPLSLEVMCPFSPLFAVLSIMDMGIGSIKLRAGFRFSFVLKIFKTRGRNILFGVPFSEYRWRSRKDKLKECHNFSEFHGFKSLN